MSAEQISRVENWVNEAILNNYPLDVTHKPREQAVEEGAMALFGETYGETVRTVSIKSKRHASYELCGGTHVPETGVIGAFLIVNEGSVAAGIRRIEAISGRAALERIHNRLDILDNIARRLETPIGRLEERVGTLLQEREELLDARHQLRSHHAQEVFDAIEPIQVAGVPILTGVIPEAEVDVLRSLTDQFRSKHPNGVVVLGSASDGQPIMIAAVGEATVKKGVKAGELVKAIAAVIDGSGGGRDTLAQAGGKDAAKLPEALAQVVPWVKGKLSSKG
jgi:alanyl-tRNA synthetase